MQAVAESNQTATFLEAREVEVGQQLAPSEIGTLAA